MFSYETRRVVFTKILNRYKDYLNLYRDLNHGSIEGAVPFPQFYWHYTYYSRYAAGKIHEARGC